MTHDFKTIEALAKRLCDESGGDWNKKRCNRNHWRKLAGERMARGPLMKTKISFGIQVLFGWSKK